ncbi:DeoR/GlpR family DNA-binding transcription regulator [Peribacillus butanolivorans]|uniref:hypothetical protein n=1 Tax=Peribacillus butanolivorans TaxID=421767 RepID=UPI0036C69BFD
MNRKSTNENEKRSIAKRASEFVENGDTLYIVYGTTTLLFTREILSKKDLTILTNSLPIANEVINYSDFEIIIIGGNVRKNEKSLFGYFCISPRKGLLRKMQPLFLTKIALEYLLSLNS